MRTLLTPSILLLSLCAPITNAQTISLVPELELPRDSESLYMSEPRRAVPCGSAFFVSDYQSNSIHKIGLAEQSSHSRAAKGSGPGEYLYPLEVACNGTTLAVTDPGNKRIHFLDLDLKHRDQFSLLGVSMSGMAYVGEKIFFVNTGHSSDSLITVIDDEGKKLVEFGLPVPSVSAGAPPAMNEGVLRVFDDQLYYLSLYYPVLRVYSLDGALLQSYALRDLADYSDRTGGNEDIDSLTRTPGSIPARYVFRGLALSKENVFLGVFEQGLLMVDRLDRSTGRYLDRHTDDSPPSERSTYIWDMWVSEDSEAFDATVLWTLVTSPRPALRAWTFGDD